MLYLEDYLEMIEHLPQELRDRFTEMREMDLQVQNSMDKLEDRVKILFTNAKKMKPAERDLEFEAIRKDYYKTLEDGDEKVHLANQMYDLVDRYLRRLDQELHKFKMELEADNKGITEILEKRSLELDLPQQNSSQKENRYSGAMTRNTQEKKQTSSSGSLVLAPIEKKSVVAEKANVESRSVPVSSVAASASAATATTTTNVNYSLGHMGAGGNAIAAAASQAIAATQQMQQGRRTASLKASYEAINLGVHAHEFSIGKELAGAAQSAIGATLDTSKKQKKKSSSSAVSTASTASVTASGSSTPVPTPPPPPPVQQSPPPVEDISSDAFADPNAENPDWTFDPNEPRYCICNQVSYGDMVACDNEDCPFEWFHYPCVGITAPPKGKWYCPQCTSSMKRRGARK